MRKFRFLFLIIFLPTFLFANIWYFNDWASCSMQNCIYNPKIDYVTVYEVISDEFSLSELNRNWIFEVGKYNNQDRGSFSLGEKVNGWLTLKNKNIGAPQPLTEWFLDTDTAPKIFQIIKPTDDFDAETYITIPSHKPDGVHGTYNGVFYREDVNSGTINAIDIDYAAHFQANEIFIHTFQVVDGIRNFLSTNYRNYYSYNYPNPVTTQGAYFRMNKTGTTVNIYFKFNQTDNWTLVKTYNNINYRNAYIGLYFKDTHIETAYANFNYFRITGTSSNSYGNMFTPIIDLGATPHGQGMLFWEQQIPDPNSYLKFYIQTSPDTNNWENWTGPYTNNLGSNIISTNNRYMRIKAEMYSSGPGLSPYFRNIRIQYPELPPAKPIITSPDCVENGWINKNNIAFTWTGADSNGVTVAGYFYSVDAPVTTASAFTTLSYVNLSNCAEGVHTFYLMAQADWQNNSLCSNIASFTFGVDFIPPTLPVVLKSSHQQFTPTNDNNFYVILSSSDNLSAIAGFSYILTKNGEEPDNTIDSITGEIQIKGLDNGEYVFKAKAIDYAGNTSGVMSYNINVDYKNNVLDKNQVKVYPTISNTKIKIAYKLNANVRKIRIDIKDSSGKTIRNIEGNTNYGESEIEEEVGNFANGVYFIKIKATRQDGKEDIVIKKFVVVK